MHDFFSLTKFRGDSILTAYQIPPSLCEISKIPVPALYFAFIISCKNAPWLDCRAVHIITY